MVHYTDTNGNKDVYYGYDIAGAKIVKAWEPQEEERMSSSSKLDGEEQVHTQDRSTGYTGRIENHFAQSRHPVSI